MTALAAEDRERVGPYRVIRAIGAGGSARIDLARIDRAYGFQRHVVLKRPLEHLRGDPAVAASLRREARLGGRLRHPGLVAILDAGVHDGYDYLVLEYVHGAALRQVMQADAPGQVRELPLGVALAIVGDAARGLHAAHELTDEAGAPLGLVHRDVSPGNVLLGLDGTVKLADFGIAKETRVATLSGSMHGTVTYMAPEQCQGHAFDRRADVFSLGVILYELVTGARLFWADNDVASLHRVLSGTVPRPRKLKPQLAPALEDLVLTAVAHDAARRFPTALALAVELERYAARAGEVLGARWIARTMAEVVGARPVPWRAAATVPDAAPAGASLVALIAAAPDEPVDPTFGEGDVATEPEGAPVVPARARRRWLPAGLAAAAAGALAGAVILRAPASAPAPSATPTRADTASASAPTPPREPHTGPAPTAPTSPAPTTPAPPAPAANRASVSAEPVSDPPPAARELDEADQPARPADKPARRKRRPSSGTRTARPAEPVAVEPPPAAAPTPAPAPAAVPAPAPAPPPPRPAQVEWKPTLLLPTDGSAHR
jgi:serine/threonine-protein kinase